MATSSSTTARWIALALAGVLAIGITLVASAPASLADAAVARASLGRVRLADAQGSIWSGSARVVLGDAQEASAAGSGALRGLAVPGTVRWSLRALPLLLGLVDATVSVGEGRPPVQLSGHPAELRVGAGGIELPAVTLTGLGSPWNTIRPTAALALQWEALTVRAGVLDGRAAIELRDLSSAMTPVRPLGTYRLAVEGNGRDVSLALRTLSGPLRLQGQGTWDRHAGVRFEAQAHAEGEDRLRLQSLLTLVGRRDGERTIVRIGG